MSSLNLLDPAAGSLTRAWFGEARPGQDDHFHGAWKTGGGRGGGAEMGQSTQAGGRGQKGPGGLPQVEDSIPPSQWGRSTEWAGELNSYDGKSDPDAWIAEMDERFGDDEWWAEMKTAAHQWANDDVQGIRDSIDQVRKGFVPDDLDNASKAIAVLEGYRQAPASSPQLYRGISLDMDSSQILSEFPKGKTFDMRMSSFSQSERIAREFASGEMHYESVMSAPPTGQVIFRLPEKSKALNISPLVGPDMVQEGEWLTAGRFQVKGVTQERSGSTTSRVFVDLEMVATL